MHFGGRVVVTQELRDRRGGDCRGLLARVAERACGDRREGHALERVRGCQRERVAVARGQKLSLAPALSSPDRPDRVIHVGGGQKTCGRNDGLARRQPRLVKRAPNLKTLFEYARAARAVNRPVHAAAALQRAVGRVDHGVRSLPRDVADGDADPSVEEDHLSLLGERSYHRTAERYTREEFQATCERAAPPLRPRIIRNQAGFYDFRPPSASSRLPA